MDVFLVIRRQKLTIFTDCKSSTTVLELKKMIEGILKTEPANMQLIKDNLIMEDSQVLQSYGLTSSTAKAQCPASLGLVFRSDDDSGEFEDLDIISYSAPPELPEVMKPQNAHKEGTAA